MGTNQQGVLGESGEMTAPIAVLTAMNAPRLIEREFKWGQRVACPIPDERTMRKTFVVRREFRSAEGEER